LQAFRSLSKLKDPSAFRPWLLTMAQNLAIDAARRDLRKKSAAPSSGNSVKLAEVASRTPLPEEVAVRDETRGQVLAVCVLCRKSTACH